MVSIFRILKLQLTNTDKEEDIYQLSIYHNVFDSQFILLAKHLINASLCNRIVIIEPDKYNGLPIMVYHRCIGIGICVAMM